MVWGKDELARARHERHPGGQPGLGAAARVRGAPLRAPPPATKTLAVVGKGITFDSGGISIKPAEGMEYMRQDMTGAATVIGFTQLAAATRLPVNVLGIFAATENLPSGSAYKPGDVFKAYNGKTLEIVNTDAEGRVILSDALAYAAEQKPDAIVDLATLTGACTVALGDHATGLMSNNQALANALIAAGERAGDRLLAAAAVAGLQGADQDGHGRRAQHAAAAAPARSPPACSCRSSSATCPGRTSTSPARPTPTRSSRTSRPISRATGPPASACACCGTSAGPGSKQRLAVLAGSRWSGVGVSVGLALRGIPRGSVHRHSHAAP